VASIRLPGMAKRTMYAAIALAFHTGLIAVATIMVYAIERLIHLLWPETGPLLFERIPLSWLFQAIDCVFILLFGAMGAYEAYQILSEEENK